MRYGFIEISGVRTHVATWGRWVEEPTPEEVIIFIPGNPGLPSLYYQYLEELHAMTKLPVWILGHAGHEEPLYTPVPLNPIGPIRGREHVFNLTGQLAHKLEFINLFTLPTTKIHLVGHSVGGWMALEILREENLVESRIYSTTMLFPTLQHLANTRNGRFLNRFVRNFTPLVLLCTFIFSKLPIFIKKLILFIYFYLQSMPNAYMNTILKFLHLSTVGKCLFMAYSELDIITDVDLDHLLNNRDRIKMLYNENDGWAPGKDFTFLRRIERTVLMESVPYNHAFVFWSSEQVANLTGRCIKEG